MVLINPQVVERRGEQYEDEGCLSLPEIREKVKRAATGKSPGAKCPRRVVRCGRDELLARAMQHEIDHLHGILFIDHLSRLKRDLVGRRIRKLIKNGEW